MMKDMLKTGIESIVGSNIIGEIGKSSFQYKDTVSSIMGLGIVGNATKRMFNLFK